MLPGVIYITPPTRCNIYFLSIKMVVHTTFTTLKHLKRREKWKRNTRFVVILTSSISAADLRVFPWRVKLK